MAPLALFAAAGLLGLAQGAGQAAAATVPKVRLGAPVGESGDRPFVDVETGRERVFHGTNVVVKGPPWLPRRDTFDSRTSLVAKDFKHFQEVGINLIRLGVMWPGVEPERGQYNETYLTLLRELVEEAGQYGVYVLLDMHQDLLSEKFCGEGVPHWAAKTPSWGLFGFPRPLELQSFQPGPDGFPTRQQCRDLFNDNPFMHGWASGQGTVADNYAYQALYSNTDGITDAWGAFWAKVAQAVSGLSNVLGYELINEPFAGNVYTNPLLALPGYADSWRLQPAYDRIVGHLHKADKDGLVFFAGVTWDNAHAVGFDHAPGGAEWANRSVLSYHFYRPPQKRPFKEYMGVRRQDAKRLGTGLMMTESCCDPFFNEAVSDLAGVGHSWVQWEWKDWCREDDLSLNSTSQAAAWGACKTGFGAGPWDNESIRPNRTVMRRLARPYAYAVAGHLLGTSWDRIRGHFNLSFEPDDVGGVTEVFLNADLAFPHGFVVQVNPKDCLEVARNASRHRLLLTLQQKVPQVTVHVLSQPPAEHAGGGNGEAAIAAKAAAPLGVSRRETRRQPSAADAEAATGEIASVLV